MRKNVSISTSRTCSIFVRLYAGNFLYEVILSNLICIETRTILCSGAFDGNFTMLVDYVTQN